MAKRAKAMTVLSVPQSEGTYANALDISQFEPLESSSLPSSHPHSFVSARLDSLWR